MRIEILILGFKRLREEMLTKSIHHNTNVASKEFDIVFLKETKEATIAVHTQKYGLFL